MARNLNTVMELSVIICTHNPKANYLERTLAALKAQTLPKVHWELLLVDNASAPALANLYDLSWHPRSRIILEAELGLTPARLRGVTEAEAPLLCFVDDDNVLDESYLEQALEIAQKRPDLGCFGGRIVGEYEEAPPPWFDRYQNMIAVRPLDRDQWSNFYDYSEATPCGAGMCVRQEVAHRYRDICMDSALRLMLDRKGNSLASSGDLDLAYTAIDMGFGVGRFVSLSLLHIIPKLRTSIDYLTRLAESTEESNIYLRHVRGQLPANLENPGNLRKWISFARVLWRMQEVHRRIHLARERGKFRGIANIRNELHQNK